MALRVMPGIQESVERQWMQEQSKVEELRTVCQATAQNWREGKKRAVFSFPVSKRRLEWIHLQHDGKQLNGYYNLSFQHDINSAVARCRVCGKESEMRNWSEVFEHEFPGSSLSYGFFVKVCCATNASKSKWDGRYHKNYDYSDLAEWQSDDDEPSPGTNDVLRHRNDMSDFR